MQLGLNVGFWGLAMRSPGGLCKYLPLGRRPHRPRISGAGPKLWSWMPQLGKPEIREGGLSWKGSARTGQGFCGYNKPPMSGADSGDTSVPV